MVRLIGLIIVSYLGTVITASSEASTPSVTKTGRGNDFSSLCEGFKCRILEDVNSQIEDMRRKITDGGICIPSFGIKSDTLCNQALESFTSQAPDPADDALSTSIYDRKLEELEASIDAPLHVLYLRQLALIREKALQSYRSGTRTTEASTYEVMMNSDALFVSEAQDVTREGSDWEYAMERSHLQTVMNDLAASQKRTVDVQLKGAQQHSTAMQFLQQQQQMIQQLQMQLYGQTSPWNVGVAYRVPDTNFNLNGSYQQGRANVQLSCVPDEYAPMLGPNGFTNGVGPGNLGLSLNLSF